MIPSAWFALTRMGPGDDGPGLSDQQGHDLGSVKRLSLKAAL